MGGFSVQYCFLLLTISTVIASFASVNCNSEGDALFTWKSKLEDPNNVLQSWDPTLINPCTWFHVTCNNDNSVVRVDLGNAGLRGPLVPELGQLSNLQYLEVYENRLSGEIPTAIGNLTQLISLDLYRNDLSGVIPYSLGLLTSLRFMRLNHNQLSGSIPSLIGNLTSLVKLHLQHNHLSGIIPSSFANLISLNSLRLNTNNLTGVIPTSLLQLITYGHLKILDVSTNNLEGRSQSKTTNSTRVVAITKIIQDPLA